MNCDILKIVRGNDFTTRMTITAIAPSGQVIPDFSLAESTDLVVKYTQGSSSYAIDEYDINGSDITIQWSGLALGTYGFEMTGVFEGEAWRYAARILFSIVADNASANIPEGYLVDGVFVMNKWLRLLAVGSVHDGFTFIPSVSEEGIISWTNNGQLPNPEPRNIRGPQGAQGPQGPKGDDGSDADVTAENIASALGYTPQEELVSGENIKTINNISLLGSGNIDIQGGGGTQVQSNWTETNTSSPAYIKNKPNLATVATSGSYNDLTNKPTIPAAQIQSDWNQTNTSAKDYIKNKPTIPVVTGKADKVSGAVSGDFAGLDANGNLTDSGKKASDFQATLVSGTNIKTVNNTSLLGSGNVSVGTYSKPSSGIPKTDLASAVQTSLGKADTAVQPEAIANLESKMAIVAASGTALTASVDNYYLFSSEVGTLAITLTTPTDTTHITKAVFMLTTGSTPAVTFAGASGINVIAQDGFSIEASTTYEINAIYNGVAWVVAAMKLSSTPINS